MGEKQAELRVQIANRKSTLYDLYIIRLYILIELLQFLVTRKNKRGSITQVKNIRGTLFSNNYFQLFPIFLAIYILAMIACRCPSRIGGKSNFFHSGFELHFR